MERGAVGTITESCLATLHGKADVKVFGPDFFLHLSHNGTALTIIDESTNETIRSQGIQLQTAKAFVTAVREGSQEPILSSYTDGLKTLAATLAGNQSFKTGQPVTLSDVG